MKKESVLSKEISRRVFLALPVAIEAMLLGGELLGEQAPLDIEAMLLDGELLGEQVPLDNEAIKQAIRTLEMYNTNAVRFGGVKLTLGDFSIQGAAAIEACQRIENWGIVDGSHSLSHNQWTPTMAAMAGEEGFGAPPVLLIPDSAEILAFPDFEYQGKMYHYVLESAEATGETRSMFRLTAIDATDEMSYPSYHSYLSLQRAVEAMDWQALKNELPSTTRDLFEYIRNNNLFNSDSVIFVFPDGYHASDEESDQHIVYHTQSRGVGDVLFSTIELHPTATPSATQLQLGTKDFMRVTMEKNDLVNTYIESRWQEVLEAEAKGETLPIAIVNFPFSLNSTNLLLKLEEFSNTIDFEKLGVLFVISASNKNEILKPSSTLQKYVHVITSNHPDHPAGILLAEDSGPNCQLFEFEETVPCLRALPTIEKSKDADAKIGWAFEQGLAGGVSFSCLNHALLAGTMVSILSKDGKRLTLQEVQNSLFDICPIVQRERNGDSYQVRAFNKEKFIAFAQGMTEEMFLPWIDTSNRQTFAPSQNVIPFFSVAI